ncbi:MAG: PAS domain-containing protein [Pseudomonadota bacterium]|nr:PAS domain-containing protein [Pseudomonadota bacterium]
MMSSAPAEILHPASRTLFRHWESVRGERGAALREHINLGEVRHLLPWMYISEPDAVSGEHRLRLAGTGICRMWQDNLTGKFLFSTWNKFERRTIGELLRGTTENCQPFAMRVRAKTATGSLTSLEILGLPVQARDSDPHQVMGIIVPFHQPAWLGRDRLISFELSSVRVVWTDQVPAACGNHQRPSGRSKPALEVIKGGKTG